MDNLDGPRNEDDQEVAEQMGGLEQGIDCLRVGLNQMSDYVKIDRFGALSEKKTCLECDVLRSGWVGSMAET